MVCTYSKVTSECKRHFNTITDKKYVFEATYTHFSLPQTQCKTIPCWFPSIIHFLQCLRRWPALNLVSLVLQAGPSNLRCYMPTLLKNICFNKAFGRHLTAFEKYLRDAKKCSVLNKPSWFIYCTEGKLRIWEALDESQVVMSHWAWQAVSTSKPMQGDLETVFTYSQIVKAQDTEIICLSRKLQCLRMKIL